MESLTFVPGQSYREILRGEFQKRTARNPLYSMRAFSRDIGIPTSRISKIFNAKGGLSTEYAEKLGSKIGLEGESLSYFVDLVDMEHGRNYNDREMAKIRLRKYQRNSEGQTIDIDKFCEVADWYNLAIIELTQLQGFKRDSDWIAQSLKISERQAREALERLIRLGLLVEDDQGELRPTDVTLVMNPNDDLIHDAIKRSHEGIIGIGRKALFDQSPKEREYLSYYVAIDKEKIPEIKQKLNQFFDQLVSELNPNLGPKKNRVYCLTTQFFNITEGLT